METSPVPGLIGAAAYRTFLPGNASPLVRQPPPVADTVEISDEGRALAARYAGHFPRDAYWEQVRYDPPHTDDPDFPWEVAHARWLQLIDSVFGRVDHAARASAQPPSAPSDGTSPK